MESREKTVSCLGQYPTPACDPCPETNRCKAFYWLEQRGFRKHNDPPEKHDYLIDPYWEAVADAYIKHPEVTYTHRYDPSRCISTPDCRSCPGMDDCANPRGVKRKPVDPDTLARRRDAFIIARLRKAKEAKVRELRALEVRSREEADAIDASGPKGSGRFPYDWMRDVCLEIRGGDDLLKLLVFIKEITRPKASERLFGELVARNRWKPAELSEFYADKSGKERSRPAALFQADYELAEKRYGWKRWKTERLLRQAEKCGILSTWGKLPPENGQKVYSVGVWMSIDGMTWIKWDWTEENGGPGAFRRFSRT